MLVWGQALNQKLAGLYNVQFATINTQVPGLLNRNLGGAWKSRLLEDPLSVPSRPVLSRPGWDSRGCLSCYRRAVHLLLTRARRLATLTGRGARQPHAHPRIRELWSGPRSVPRPPLAGSEPSPPPIPTCALRLHAPRGAFLRADLARLPTRLAPLIYMRRPAPCTIIYMPRPTVLSFSLAVGGSSLCCPVICVPHLKQPQPSGALAYEFQDLRIRIFVLAQQTSRACDRGCLLVLPMFTLRLRPRN